jgi:hypothetical protein
VHQLVKKKTLIIIKMQQRGMYGEIDYSNLFFTYTRTKRFLHSSLFVVIIHPKTPLVCEKKTFINWLLIRSTVLGEKDFTAITVWLAGLRHHFSGLSKVTVFDELGLVCLLKCARKVVPGLSKISISDKLSEMQRAIFISVFHTKRKGIYILQGNIPVYWSCYGLEHGVQCIEFSIWKILLEYEF